MFYKDGKTEPKKGDTVLGDKFKGVVATVLKSTVAVRVRAPLDRRRPDVHATVDVEKDPSQLDLVRRG